jgi:pimeloyl-ACP methyl ester carboxylesterase
MNFRARLIDRPNPVQTEYLDREDTIEIHMGFSEYLLRRRLDNGKTKFDEIAHSVQEIANELGGNCRVHVTGHSLGAALATIFALYASADTRFASKESPIKLFSFASPYTGGTSFAKAFRHQEQAGLLMHARFHHQYDPVTHVAPNTAWHPSGTEYLHTGLGVKLHNNTKKPPTLFFLMDFSHNSLLRQRLGNFFLFHLPWFQLGNTATFHYLKNYSESLAESFRANSKESQCADIEKKSLEELYEDYSCNK